MSPLRVLRGFSFGALGGFLGWLLVEFGFRLYEQDAIGPRLVGPTSSGTLGGVLGLTIGFFLGVSEGIGEGTTVRFKRAVGWFTLLGMVGGFVGLYFGQILFTTLGGRIEAPDTVADFFHQIVTRALAWMMIGLFLGGVFGVPNMSSQRIRNGAVGGALGGFLGGFVFQALGSSGLLQGMQLRLIGFTLIGAAIGFFINLMAEALKRVWVRVLVGRNEGREHIIDTPIAVIGRDELVEVPVFLDPSVPKRMATLRSTGGRYAIQSETNAMPLYVNGQPAQPGQVLRDGDAIQFGKVTLAYYEKASVTGGVRPVDAVSLNTDGPSSYQTAPTGPAPTPGGLPGYCSYCGQPQDPLTGACLCTVPDGGATPGGYGAAAPQPGGYAQSPYRAEPAWAAPTAAYDPGAAQNPAYAPTMMSAPPPAPAGFGAPGAPGARLTVIGGPHAGQVFPISGGESGIGREPTQAIGIPGDPKASRRHARIIGAPNGYFLEDQNSSNGTFVNGMRIQQHFLVPGDVVIVGSSEFRFEV